MPDPILSLNPMDDSSGFLDRTHLNHGDSRDDNFSDDIPNKKNKRVVAWGCTRSGLVITIKVGKVYFKGVSKPITSKPNGWPEVTVASTTHGYLSVSLVDGVVTWGTSESDPGDGDDDTEIWRIFVATVSDNKITELLECQHGDIHCVGNA